MRRIGFLLLAAALLAGCGGDTVSLDPIAQAADKTADVASARFTMSVEAQDGATGLIKFSGPGAIADHGKRMQMRMTLEPTATTPRFTMQMLLVDNTFYVRSPLFATLLPGGNKWLKFRDRAGDVFGGIGQNDPGQLLEFLRATADIEKREKATIRGVETTHYHADVDLDRVADLARPEYRERLRALVDQIEAAGVDKIPLEAWVGDDGLVRRMKMDWRLSNPDKPAERGTFKFTLDLFDFGAAATIKAPPARDVIAAPRAITGG